MQYKTLAKRLIYLLHKDEVCVCRRKNMYTLKTIYY